MIELTRPSVTALQFFSAQEIARSGLKMPFAALEEYAANAVIAREEKQDYRSFLWKPEEDIIVFVDTILAHDTHILRLSVQGEGEQPVSAWSEQRVALDNLLQAARAAVTLPDPWAATLIYAAAAPARFHPDHLVNEIRELAALDPLNEAVEQPDQTPFGWIWQLGSHLQKLGGRHTAWLRTLAVLVPMDRYEKVRSTLLHPLTQGIPRIELYLQKGLHHARQHENVRSALETARVNLQDDMLVALRTVDFRQIQHEQQALEEISRKLMVFLAEKAQTEVLLNSLRSNFQTFSENLERVKLDSTIYAAQSAVLKREIEQLESDLANAQAVSESAYTFQDIQRSIEGNRLERAGVLLGAAAAILAGLAIFNNFLDIWNLAVEKSGMTLPDPWLRVLLGAAAGIFWPLGAFWAVKRMRWQAALALFLGVLAVALAVIFTVLVNR